MLPVQFLLSISLLCMRCLLVAREALYNSIRHAQPRKVELAVAFEEILCAASECATMAQDSIQRCCPGCPKITTG